MDLIYEEAGIGDRIYNVKLLSRVHFRKVDVTCMTIGLLKTEVYSSVDN